MNQIIIIMLTHWLIHLQEKGVETAEGGRTKGLLHLHLRLLAWDGVMVSAQGTLDVTLSAEIESIESCEIGLEACLLMRLIRRFLLMVVNVVTLVS